MHHKVFHAETQLINSHLPKQSGFLKNELASFCTVSNVTNIDTSIRLWF